jgi:hypothetical protein
MVRYGTHYQQEHVENTQNRIAPCKYLQYLKLQYDQ